MEIIKFEDAKDFSNSLRKQTEYGAICGGFISEGKSYIVEVTDEENFELPHFHLKSENFDAVLHMWFPKYYNKSKYKDRLNGKLKEDLIKWFQLEADLIPKNKTHKTYWQVLNFGWKNATDRKIKFLRKTIPNYLKLNGGIS